MNVLRSNGNLTRKEAAEYLRISVRTLDKLAKEGEIPYSKLGDGIRARVVYQHKDLDAYVERTRVDPRSTARKILEAS
jgi:excisionase family DNA binding protein